jgi:hypothetical protein
MSIIGIVMNGLLVSLLLAALTVGLRLNKRLKALRDSQDGFASAVQQLNTAAARAEQGLADLRAATDEATDLLADRIEKGHSLAARLDRMLEHAPARAEAVLPDPETMERRFGALLAAAREVRTPPPLRREPLPAAARSTPPLRQAAAPLRQAPSLRRPADPDDELFDNDDELRLALGARR